MVEKYFGFMQGGVVDDTTQLSAIATSYLPDLSTLVYVRSESLDFRLEKTSTAIVDGVNVIATDTGAGRWIKYAVGGAADGYHLSYLNFRLSGEYSSAVVPGFFEPPFLFSSPWGIILSASLIRRTAGTSGTTRVDVLQNGVSLFGGIPASMPQVDASSGDNYSSIKNLSDITRIITATDYIDVSLEEVETYKIGPPEGPEGIFVSLTIKEPLTA